MKTKHLSKYMKKLSVLSILLPLTFNSGCITITTPPHTPETIQLIKALNYKIDQLDQQQEILHSSPPQTIPKGNKWGKGLNKEQEEFIILILNYLD